MSRQSKAQASADLFGPRPAVFSPDALSAGFDAFWARYPRKQGKYPAWKVWQRLKPAAALEQAILTAVDQQASSRDWQKDGGQYVPMPKTWLGQHRWLDGVACPPTADRYAWNCPHEPRCLGRHACRVKTVLDKAKRFG